ncbi:MAG: VOC family protein [Armatimonadetes bacterium]|nr:VOC family protein [Armatimonadota bacterium]MDE2206153.1 VOC family protein [Armatimonadota bacterium]
MSGLPARAEAITLFVADRHRSKAFYHAVFAIEPIFEDQNSVAFRFESLIVNLLEVREAPTLIGPAKVGSPESGARFQLTIGVTDIDAACATLAENGVSLINGPMDRPWGMRTACFMDPDGHIWEVGAELR